MKRTGKTQSLRPRGEIMLKRAGLGSSTGRHLVANGQTCVLKRKKNKKQLEQALRGTSDSTTASFTTCTMVYGLI